MAESPERFTVDCSTEVEVTINDPDVVERVTGPKGDEWRAQLYDLRTREDVVKHLAIAHLITGHESASKLDGWADLPADAATMETVATQAEDVLDA